MATRKAKLMELEVLAKAAECLRVLARRVRLRMVQMLLRDSYSVGELADVCDVASHVASEHLRLMQHCGFCRNGALAKSFKHFRDHYVDDNYVGRDTSRLLAALSKCQ